MLLCHSIETVTMVVFIGTVGCQSNGRVPENFLVNIMRCRINEMTECTDPFINTPSLLLRHTVPFTSQLITHTHTHTHN